MRQDTTYLLVGMRKVHTQFWWVVTQVLWRSLRSNLSGGLVMSALPAHYTYTLS